MADWRKLTSRGRVEDRRGFGPALGGGLGLAGIAVAVLFTLLGGGDVTDVLNQLATTAVPSQQVDTSEFEGFDSYEAFASTVIGSTNDMWTEIFNRNNMVYEDPRLVLFRTATDSACGGANSQVGPHYCPLDKTIYIDETFFEELQRRFGAQGGDVAEAYVLAHEAAHHAQNELGIMNSLGDDRSNEDSVNLELQADCFAGLWAHSIRDLGVLAPGEIEEAIDAAKAVGDDRIQERATGRVNPESWTHGSSAQRAEWFARGYESGDIASCDTFNN